MDPHPDMPAWEARLTLRLKLAAAVAALDGLQLDLDHVDRILARMGDASTNAEHLLHVFR